MLYVPVHRTIYRKQISLYVLFSLRLEVIKCNKHHNKMTKKSMLNEIMFVY